MRDGVSASDVLTLQTLAQRVGKPNAIFIEIGSWLGHSSSILGEIAREHGGQVFCVDHWKGSPTVLHHQIVKDALNIFLQNMKQMGLENYVHPLVMESQLASRIIADNIADLIFIDADHRYDAIKQDLELWWRKVKQGGYLCGHDCERIYSECAPPERQRIDEHCNEDYINDVQCHPGVSKALYEVFHDEYKRVNPHSTIWVKQKE